MTESNETTKQRQAVILVGDPVVVPIASMAIDWTGVREMARWVKDRRPACLPDGWDPDNVCDGVDYTKYDPQKEVVGEPFQVHSIRKVIASDPGGILKDVLVVLLELGWENDDALVSTTQRIEEEIERRVDGCVACAEAKEMGGVWNGTPHTCGAKVEPVVVTTERPLDLDQIDLQLMEMRIERDAKDIAIRWSRDIVEADHLRKQKDDLQRDNTRLVLENRELRAKNPSALRGQVAAFMHAFDQPMRDKPGIPIDNGKDPHAWVRLRVELVLEEAFELVEACFYVADVACRGPMDLLIDFVRNASVRIDLPAACDALGDLLYVTQGAFLTFGVDEGPVLDEIHRSNMAKVGGPVDLVTKKKLKPPGWTPPDIVGVLKRQG